MEKYAKVMWFMSFFFIAVMGLWMINDAFAAINLERSLKMAAFVGNGFFYHTPAQAFHIGMWMVMLGVIAITAINVHLLDLDKGA